MNNLKETEFWKKKYGVLPLHLKSMQEDRYLMLNGGDGDFCLQTYEDGDTSLFNEYAWSSDTKNYLVIGNDNVKVINWLQDSTEKFSAKSVLDNIDKFHKYLLQKSYKTSNDVIPFILHIFRQLRNEANEKHSPVESLNLLFQLLVGIDRDNTNPDFYQFEKIKTPERFEFYLEQLKKGVRSIKPNIDLILRHISGTLFEEAHKEVLYFDHQLDLFGGVSSRQKTMNIKYSGIHYTPSFIARSIVENSLREINLDEKDKLKIVDPSCGSSQFLIEVLKQLKNRGYNGNTTIVGYDVSETAIQTSEFLLHYENYTQWDGKLNIILKKVDNSLEVEWGNDIDLLLMNPPFISWELMKRKPERDILASILGDELKTSKPNLASGFLYKAIKSLSDGGVIGCIMPTSVFNFDSYHKMREEIKEIIDLKIIAKLGNYSFDNALTDVSVLVGKKPGNNSLPQVIWTKNEKGIVSDALRELRRMQSNNEIASINKSFNIYTPKSFPIMRNSWKLVTQSEEDFINDLVIYLGNESLVPVSDIFNVRQGIRSGSKIFIIEEYQFKNLPKNEHKYFRKIINNKSIKNGRILSHEYIFYPYNEDKPIFTDEDMFKKKAPATYRYFVNYRNELSGRARKSSDDWWTLSEHRAWARKPEKRLYSTEFGSSDSFAFDSTGEFVVERGNAWIPKKEFEEIDYYFYLSILSSSMFERLLDIFAKPILAGYYLGADSTKNIPIPSLEFAKRETNISHYLKLSELGQSLSKGDTDSLYYINKVVEHFYPELK